MLFRSNQSYTGTKTGNSITSAYSLNQSATATYSMSETDGQSPSAYALTETGTLTSTTTESRNTIVGTYDRTITGTDDYSLEETGTNSGCPYLSTPNVLMTAWVSGATMKSANALPPATFTRGPFAGLISITA